MLKECFDDTRTDNTTNGMEDPTAAPPVANTGVALATTETQPTRELSDDELRVELEVLRAREEV